MNRTHTFEGDGDECEYCSESRDAMTGFDTPMHWNEEDLERFKELGV